MRHGPDRAAKVQEQTVQRTNVRVPLFRHTVENFERLVHGCPVPRVVRECNVDHDEDYGG